MWAHDPATQASRQFPATKDQSPAGNRWDPGFLIKQMGSDPNGTDLRFYG